ncbi:MAG: phage tail assembly protein [Anaerolineae bacterium]|nr:phage tail assembly protein [Anaerolineae bacterium]
MLQTEFDFTLPKGYVDEAGNVYREGTMRLATALDQIAPLQDPRVRLNEAYATIILLSRVITRLGAFRHISAEMIEKLFSTDFTYLESFYRRINEEHDLSAVVCPYCQSQFEVAT